VWAGGVGCGRGGLLACLLPTTYGYYYFLLVAYVLHTTRYLLPSSYLLPYNLGPSDRRIWRGTYFEDRMEVS
jgi:hypothetical protein